MDLSYFKHEYDRNSFLHLQPDGKKFRMWTNEHCAPIYESPSFEALSIRMVEALSARLACFVDVGAHHGYYSLLVGSLSPNCKILAFEASSENYLTMDQNLKENNNGNVKTYSCAISNVEETMDFYISTASDNCGFIAHPATPTRNTVRVQAHPLDAFRHEMTLGPTLIKIDTEGHELEVLEGMQGIIDSTPDLKLLIEFNPKLLKLAGHAPDQLLTKLDSLGFELYLLSDAEGLFFRLPAGVDWQEHLTGNIAANILCLKKQPRLNVLFFSHSSRLTGAELSLLETITHFVNRGSMCTVILPSPGPLVDMLQKAGAATLIREFYWWCTVETPDLEQQIQQLSESLRWVLEDQDLFRKINPDLVFTNTTVHPWGALAAKAIERPHLWSVTEFGELANLQYVIPFAEVLKFIQDHASFVLTNSKAMQTALFPDLGVDRVETIYRSIQISAHRQEQKGKSFFSDAVTRLIIPGTIIPVKGQMDAVLAVRELVKQGRPHVELLIIGLTGSKVYHDELLEAINLNGLEKNIHIIDFQENIFPILQQADIVLTCSRMEAFGRSTLEAMLCEKPVIGVNRGGTPELVQNGRTGFLYEPGDYRDLAEKIGYLCDHPEERETLGRNGLAYAREKFTVEKTYERLLQIGLMVKDREGTSQAPMMSLMFRLLKNVVDAVGRSKVSFSSQSDDLLSQLRDRENELREIHQSKIWRYALLYRSLKERLNRELRRWRV
jgi:FkbM family methyltransferase